MLRPKKEHSPVRQELDLAHFTNQQESYIEFLEEKLKEKPVVPPGLGRHHWGSLSRSARYYAYPSMSLNRGVSLNIVESDRYKIAYKHLSDTERSYIDRQYIEIVKYDNERFKNWQAIRTLE